MTETHIVEWRKSIRDYLTWINGVNARKSLPFEEMNQCGKNGFSFRSWFFFVTWRRSRRRRSFSVRFIAMVRLAKHQKSLWFGVFLCMMRFEALPNRDLTEKIRNNRPIKRIGFMLFNRLRGDSAGGWVIWIYLFILKSFFFSGFVCDLIDRDSRILRINKLHGFQHFLGIASKPQRERSMQFLRNL